MNSSEFSSTQGAAPPPGTTAPTSNNNGRETNAGDIIPYPDVGLAQTPLLLPKPNIPLDTWAVIACDQFTDNSDYWDAVYNTVNDSPSTLHYIIPEIFIAGKGTGTAADDTPEARVAACNQRMRDDLENGTLSPTPPLSVLTERYMEDGSRRLGLVTAIDLECYAPYSDAPMLIQPTEKTFPDRVHTRAALRRNAPIELPHILLLYAAPEQNILPPVLQEIKQDKTAPLYDGPLMLGGGKISGYPVSGAPFEKIISGYRALHQQQQRPGSESGSALFYIGDGNHALAAAWQHWQEYKRTLSPQSASAAEAAPPQGGDHHPACRYALVELTNIYDPGLKLLPIHQLLTGSDQDWKMRVLRALNARRITQPLEEALADNSAREEIILYCSLAGQTTVWQSQLQPPPSPQGEAQPILAAVALDERIGKLAADDALRHIFVHDTDELRDHCTREDGLAMFMPPISRAALMGHIAQKRVLPKKSFSIGLAPEKRYYLEARQL